VCVHVFMYACMNVCMHVCMHVCMPPSPTHPINPYPIDPTLSRKPALFACPLPHPIYLHAPRKLAERGAGTAKVCAAMLLRQAYLILTTLLSCRARVLSPFCLPCPVLCTCLCSIYVSYCSIYVSHSASPASAPNKKKKKR